MIEVMRFVNQLSDWPVIEGNDNGPRPDAPFVSVLLTSDQAEGTPFTSPTGNDVAISSLEYSVQFHGSGAVDAAGRFRDRADSGRYRVSQPYIYESTSGIQRLDELLSEEYHERALMTLKLKRARHITIDIDPVASAGINLTINDQTEPVD